MKVNLYIERLVMEGSPLTIGQGALVQQAVESEIAKLFEAGELHNIWQSDVNAYRLQPFAIQVTAENKPAHLGEQIAGAVYGGLIK